MRNETFEVGQAVRISTAFLRSIDPSAARGWPTRYDHGKGMVAHIVKCGDFDLVTVWFWDGKFAATYNSGNLIHDTPRNVYNEAMRSEHKSRGI